jgi:hypothetical protein
MTDMVEHISDLNDRIQVLERQTALDKKQISVWKAWNKTLSEGFKKVQSLYDDLIMQVECKYGGETRHETARRYIIEREIPTDREAQTARET